MIAREPGPVRFAEQRQEAEPVGVEQRGCALVAMEAVAQRDDAFCARVSGTVIGAPFSSVDGTLVVSVAGAVTPTGTR